MIIEHICSPINKFTFKPPKIKAWVTEQCEGRVLNLFAGITKLDVDETRNDIRHDMPADYHYDALEFVLLCENKFDTILVDPPYSYRKSMELYEGAVMSPFRKLKDAIPKVLAPGGKVITFGYHSVSMGRSRNFEIERICIVSHGGATHDTIISIERNRK